MNNKEIAYQANLSALNVLEAVKDKSQSDLDSIKYFRSQISEYIASQKDKQLNIVLVIDKSGSMYSTRNDTIGAVNSYVDSQRKLGVNANIEVVLFDTSVKIIHELSSLENFKGLSETNYSPMGGTSLYDAFGLTIDRYKKSTDDIVLVLLTDGEETSSRSYNKTSVSALLKEVQEKLEWEVIFLGANIKDFKGFTQAMHISATKSFNFEDSGIGRSAAMLFSSNHTSSYATAKGYVATDLLKTDD